LKHLEGTARADRMNHAEPIVSPGWPPTPNDLPGPAAEAWQRFGAILSDMGVLTPADGPALERLARVWGELVEARESYLRPMVAKGFGADAKEHTVAPGGQPTYLSRGKDGWLVRARPELALIAEADRRLRAHMSDFGLTPSSRSKIKVPDGPESPSDYF